jgi:hypothetical protein
MTAVPGAAHVNHARLDGFHVEERFVLRRAVWGSLTGLLERIRGESGDPRRGGLKGSARLLRDQGGADGLCDKGIGDRRGLRIGRYTLRGGADLMQWYGEWTSNSRRLLGHWTTAPNHPSSPQ